ASEKSHDWERAMSMLEQMQVVEVAPNEYSFSSAIKALSSAVQWQRALQTLGLAQDRQSCNVVGFSAVMGACVKATQWTEALDIFSQIWWAEESPDTLCYNAVLNACQ
ncbi:MRL1, partial [Symbiodinium necroappetens]